jgi:hypothetical protein
LVLLANARQEENWTHTSTVLAMMANINRDLEKHPQAFTPADFNPFAKKDARRRIPLTKAITDQIKSREETARG